MASLSLSSLLVPNKSTEVAFPGFDGFVVKVNYITREKIISMRKKATKQSFSGRQLKEELDDELFAKLYASQAISGWSGLKFSYLEQIAPVDISGQKPEDELEYTEENAHFLMKNSPTFDNWVAETVSDLGKFQTSSTKK